MPVFTDENFFCWYNKMKHMIFLWIFICSRWVYQPIVYPSESVASLSSFFSIGYFRLSYVNKIIMFIDCSKVFIELALDYIAENHPVTFFTF